MVGNQQTDAASLLLSATFLSRLTTPLSLNYLAMSHLDNGVTPQGPVSQDTSFTRTMGHAAVIAFLKDFSKYYPFVLVAVALLTLFRAGPRILALFGVQGFLQDDEGTEDYVIEGKALIRRHFREQGRCIRDAAAAARAEKLREKVGNRAGGSGSGSGGGSGSGAAGMGPGNGSMGARATLGKWGGRLMDMLGSNGGGNSRSSSSSNSTTTTTTTTTTGNSLTYSSRSSGGRKSKKHGSGGGGIDREELLAAEEYERDVPVRRPPGSSVNIFDDL